METKRAIEVLGEMHIRTCKKSMWSNGKDRLGGTFKVSKSYLGKKDRGRGLTSLPSSSLSHNSFGPSSDQTDPLLPSVQENQNPLSIEEIYRTLGVDFLG